MKKEKVKELLYSIRCEIIDEIGELDRMMENSAEQFIKDGGSFRYGYRRGLTEAAMIMLERIYEKFPEEKDED